MNTNEQADVTQRSHVNGFKKAHAFFFPLSFIETTIVTPDSVYGIVKSTYSDLFAMIVTSPTIASYFCQSKKKVFNIVLQSQSSRDKKIFDVIAS
jgi:transcription elongation factor